MFPEKSITPVMIQDQIALEKIQKLLQKNKLPYKDVKLDGGITIGYHGLDNTLLGSGALEFYGRFALLRSVAVEEIARGHSFGKYIVDDLLARAKAQGIKAVYLLTETAHDFFLKKGFRDVARDQVPSEVHASTEFTSVCPVSASCMVYELK
jgi:amino-acid N-acetyltransferase